MFIENPKISVAIPVCDVKNKFYIKMPHFISILITFLFVNITWVYFRADSIQTANKIISSMFGFNGFSPIIIDKLRFSFENGSLKLSLLLLIPSFILVFCIKNSLEFSKKLKPNGIFFIATLIMLLSSILSINNVFELL